MGGYHTKLMEFYYKLKLYHYNSIFFMFKHFPAILFVKNLVPHCMKNIVKKNIVKILLIFFTSMYEKYSSKNVHIT